MSQISFSYSSRMLLIHRMSYRLCSVPEEASAVLTRDGRERAKVDEDRRRISASGMTVASKPAAEPQSSSEEDTYRARVVKSSEHLVPASESFILAGKPRRLSVGALVGMSVLKMTELKRSSEGLKNVPSSAQSTSPSANRIRNKTIPIINPVVRLPNWPSNAYKKGITFLFFCGRII